MDSKIISMMKDSKDGSKSKRMNLSQRKLLADEEMLHRRALSMAIHQAQLSQIFDGSMSRRARSTGTRKQRTLSDPFSNGKQVTGSLPFCSIMCWFNDYWELMYEKKRPLQNWRRGDSFRKS
ncbi:unnamed protein product [Brassica rapa]|uniref:Uncharacterized protein n=2 Tax=Brassica TaxID=3705 RepID=A0A3P5ZFI9_BRACM|nr:unnamed protein product [Brassica napus]CAG7876420.1 unnamed protein product [Brassica rapa]VDC71580.1 unnamed protein product [Brassica rapa]